MPKLKIDLKDLTIRKAHDALKKGDFTVIELAEEYLKTAKDKNKDLNAYLEFFNDIEEQAESAQKKFKDGTATLLTGIPFAVKDNILISGKIASASSKMLEKYHATYDSTVISKLKKEGAVFLGRTNMDEFAMGSSTENSALGVTKNPYDPSRVSGGSSGGSAAAVAMDGCLAALGTDTGGSVRQPASLCGCVGLKPTYGAVSRYGLIAMGSSLDQAGPLAKNVEDTEIIFNAIKGKDSFDSTTIDESTYSKKEKDYSKLTVGVPSHFLNQGGLDPEVLKNFYDAVEKFKKLGYRIEDVSLPNISFSLPVYYIVMPAEISSNLARYDGVKYGFHKDGADVIDDYFVTRAEGFGKEVRRRIMLGTYVLSTGYYDAYYNKANIVRSLIKKDFLNAFEKVDIIITPTTPTPAFKIGEKTTDPLQMYLEDIFTVTANLTGMPAMSIPSGKVLRDGKELPLGLQMTANLGREDILFEAGKRFLGEIK